MQDSQFHITSYHGSVPASGYCDKCHGSFTVRDEWRATPEDARKQLQADFDELTPANGLMKAKILGGSAESRSSLGKSVYLSFPSGMQR
jgi:hypothetical protein